MLGFLMILAAVILLRLVYVLAVLDLERQTQARERHDEQFRGFLRFLARVRAASLARHW